MTIFDIVTANDIALYWNAGAKDRSPFVGEELFPSDKQLGLKLSWLKGAAGLPVVLKPSAFDVSATLRPRIGITKLETEMPFFKEAQSVDEEQRQQLNMVLQTKNQNLIDAVANRIFNDQLTLLEGARARREQMRMMALTTGAISVTANGQAFEYDYGVPADHKVTVTTSWSNLTGSDPIADIRAGLDKIENDTGVRPTRAMTSAKAWGYIRRNDKVIKSVYVLSNGQATVSDTRLKDFLKDELGIQVYVNEKRYKGDDGAAHRYIEEDTFVLFPEGGLGKTWFGTTPEESDLMTGSAANVAITDTGVAVTSVKKVDPVTVETKVTMICLPSFEQADKVYILDITA